MRTATKEVIDLLGGEKLPFLDSPALRWEKFVDLTTSSGEDQTKEKENPKKKEINDIVLCVSQKQTAPDSFLEKITGNRQTVHKLSSRMIVNQACGILENAGICIHRHFGYPYLPGSAVKGCARHFAWEQWKELYDQHLEEEAIHAGLRLALTFGYPTGDPDCKDENNNLIKKGLDTFLREKREDLFANGKPLQSYAGSVSFFPANPVGKANLEVDIVNCHHPNYYSGKQTKAVEDEDPVPNFFPAVQSGTLFVFTLAPVHRSYKWILAESGMAGFNPIRFAEECLVNALRQNGIGAKTAAGYGWFQLEEAETRKREEKRLERELQKRKELEDLRRKAELASMSPEDRRVLEWKNSELDHIKSQIRELPNFTEFEQKCLLHAILEHFPQYWREEKKAKPGKKSEQKAWERAEILRKIADKLGVQLP